MKILMIILLLASQISVAHLQCNQVNFGENDPLAEVKASAPPAFKSRNPGDILFLCSYMYDEFEFYGKNLICEQMIDSVKRQIQMYEDHRRMSGEL